MNKNDSKGSFTTKESAAALMKKAIAYKFNLKDLNKYSSKLRVTDLNWKYRRSSLGKEILAPDERKTRLKKESYLNKLMKSLRHTDW